MGVSKVTHCNLTRVATGLFLTWGTKLNLGIVLGTLVCRGWGSVIWPPGLLVLPQEPKLVPSPSRPCMGTGWRAASPPLSSRIGSGNPGASCSLSLFRSGHILGAGEGGSPGNSCLFEDGLVSGMRRGYPPKDRVASKAPQ